MERRRTDLENIKVIEEEIEHLNEHMQILNALCKQRELAYHNTREALFQLRKRHAKLDMARALRSKSTTAKVAASNIKQRLVKEKSTLTVSSMMNSVRHLSKDQALSLLEKLAR